MSKPEYQREETVGFLGSQSIIRAWPCDGGGAWLLARGDYDHHQDHQAALVPADPAELHRLTEAIHGRKIAAVIYEDELEHIDTEDDAYDLPVIGTTDTAERAWGAVRRWVTIARWREARDAEDARIAAEIDAANAEAERETEALAEELCRADTCYSANDPHVKTVAERLVKAGVLAPQDTTDGGE